MFCVFLCRPDKWTYTGENFEKSFTLIGQNIMSSIKTFYIHTIMFSIDFYWTRWSIHNRNTLSSLPFSKVLDNARTNVFLPLMDSNVSSRIIQFKDLHSVLILYYFCADKTHIICQIKQGTPRRSCSVKKICKAWCVVITQYALKCQLTRNLFTASPMTSTWRSQSVFTTYKTLLRISASGK